MKEVLGPVLLVWLMGVTVHGEVDFNRDVRPILAGHCFACHGPDDKQRKAKLRLDTQSAAHAKVIVPGKPDASELIERLFTDETEDAMPPASEKNPLTEAQKATLRRWVAEGAEYEQHWSFAPPQRPSLPEVKNMRWASNGIDRFIQAKLDSEAMEPSKAANRWQLVRRLYLSLLGVPPSPEEADAFVQDTSPAAYERLVDRLLASPLYGERWARRWLDLARYADTNGYEKDRPRSIWPYRDWVINALNADMPFDRFSIEQLAGDLLPNPTSSQKIATGFHRNTMLNEEGGIDPLEYRFHSLVDRVGTTGTVWLGLTVACAQCHTHKFDPIQHTEYYQMMAFLNNADEPDYVLPNNEFDALEDEIARQEEALAGQVDPTQFATWFATQAADVGDWRNLRPVQLRANLAKLEQLDDESVLASGDQTKRDIYTLSFEGDFTGVTGLRLEALPDDSLPRSGPGRAYYEGPKGDFFLSELKLTADGNPVAITSATESYGKLGIGGGAATAMQAIDGNEVTGWSTSGGEGQPHQAVFVFDQALTQIQTLQVELVFNRHYPATLGRFRIAVSKDPTPSSATTLATELDPLFHKTHGVLTPAERQQLSVVYAQQANETKAAREAIAALRRQRPEPLTTLTFLERPADNPRPTFRHHRGEFLQPEESVEPGVPAIFPGMPESYPQNRLGFAQWLMSSRNPLVARVTVNRDWSAFFGRGLVATTGDFGYQGESPSHPKLLDWLATQFADDHWSRKRLHHHMVTSATFRQQSSVSTEHRQRDPSNLLLGRAPRFRIEAELVRDTALKIAGLLTNKLGGPSVYPPQPASVTTEGAYGKLAWKVSEGEDRYRRGLYTFAKRTAPYAMFATFDAGSGEACIARREVTNTPLQALTALNDEVMIEAARALGRQIATCAATSTEARAKLLFRLVLTRPPDDEELRWLIEFFDAQRLRFSSDATMAQSFLDLSEPPEQSELANQAAWAAAARALLNLDETFVHQ